MFKHSIVPTKKSVPAKHRRQIETLHWIGMCARFDINLWLYFIYPGLGWGIWNYFLCCWQREDLLCLRYFHCINACKPGIRSMGLDGSVILSTGVCQTYKCRMWLLSIVSEDHVQINHWSGDISLLMLFRRFWQMNLVQIQYNFWTLISKSLSSLWDLR